MHLPVLARLRDQRELELALICDLQPERAAAARRRFGFSEETGDGIAAIGRPDIDVVYAFGSAQLHFEYGLAALRDIDQIAWQQLIAVERRAIAFERDLAVHTAVNEIERDPR